MAAKLSKDAGIAYRYGSADAAVDNTGVPTLFAHDPANPLDIPGRGTLAGTWQIGGAPTADAGLYSTSAANLTYVADDPSQRMGVTDLQITGYQYNTFAQTPQLSWTVGGTAAGLMDSFTAASYKRAGVVTGDPVAMGRCSGQTGFCNQSLVAYQNGVIGTAGSNTASTPTTVKLPANKVPTGIAMTNDSEFALVTVWDTTALKGQVAVVALAGLCPGCDPYSPSSTVNYWYEWGAAYPGLFNVGNIAFMKILGYVDLPGMTAPTEIAVTTGLNQWLTLDINGRGIAWQTPLTSQSNRQSFLPGGANYGRYAKGGVAVVISKSEQKVAFIDLKPLFTYVNSVYFGGDQATFNSRMASLGQADNQWPYTFTQQPSQVPTVVKTVSLAQRPTAVKTSVYDGASRAWVATQDGTLHIYALDGYANGASPPAPAANALTEVGTVTGIGRNPTSIASSKGEPSGNTQTQVLVNSRTDRKVSWVRFASNGNSGSIVRTLQDSRLADPIAVEDADNFATMGYVVSVADYAGKALRNYRYGPVVFADGKACATTTSCPVTPTGNVAIEYAGAMPYPGKPFQLKTANVP
ncbi:hypothetical protein QTI17_11695 [Variovorax sp. J31P179]|uniref:hypothetical protein n=1 Tax=Variovorax sp. J31P179 TaxID=3053508 RepID=UPI002575285D|nr:hypothetical protein [Variovorax sp. J31P179]MDM0081258.1 hypothetical protein [Variovorax sp. J31P179]